MGENSKEQVQDREVCSKNPINLPSQTDGMKDLASQLISENNKGPKISISFIKYAMALGCGPLQPVLEKLWKLVQKCELGNLVHTQVAGLPMGPQCLLNGVVGATATTIRIQALS